ncbi:hypothetical protein F7642_12770 [Tenacibaculum finnmarkense genomovar ulcerans]|uniref:hypothetical protein n=1 Tax=Tenacibaculum finnmarkense TaxID=2781243 RepID=UPI00187B4B72|nr:hypothetical protein [Tenacibaculum finnmarkense]MBE7635192.1 hypothetical protein [Tenacibaculum finnmarkense genomovar ulcerans]MCD8425018.1 hypothetical protein [Tenacibaculum dicentrarchi]MCD8431142.1 hypothetical protein [Tenacibaculum finnmarkense genomovar ulcerans]MCG8821413.1 hypothetical protein [Tenacibaculum finnmarkense]
MSKDKILYDYLDYFLTNAKLDDETFIENEYDRYSKKIRRDDKLREHIFGLENLLTTLGFIYEPEPNVIFLTEKGIEARNAGGYYKYIKSKNKLTRYQKIALGLSVTAIVITLVKLSYDTFFKPKDDSIVVLEKKVDSLTLKYDFLIQKFHTAEIDSLNATNDNLSLTKKDSLPNK